MKGLSITLACRRVDRCSRLKAGSSGQTRRRFVFEEQLGFTLRGFRFEDLPG